MLAGASLTDEQENKWLVGKKEINEHREYEVARAAMVATEAKQMEVEQVTGMAAAQQAARMASRG